MGTDTFFRQSLTEPGVQDLARKIARDCGPGEIIMLEGPLGSGKTAFARAFIRARLDRPEMEVPSPSFNLAQYYENGDGSRVAHFDLYRLSNPDEAVELGIDDALADSIVLIEWPERLGTARPASGLTVRLQLGEERGRRLVALQGGEAWRQRLHGVADVPA